MRAVLHRDGSKARIVRLDRRGRPEGRVTEIIERPDRHHRPLLREGGVWLVAPEDKRYGRTFLIPKGRHGPSPARNRGGQADRAARRSAASRSAASRRCWANRRPGISRDRGAQVRRVPMSSPEAALAQARGAARQGQAGRQQEPYRPDRQCRWSPSTARTRAISTMRSIASPSRSGAARTGACWWRLPTSGSHYVDQPVPRSTSTPTTAPPVSPAPRDPDAAGEALQRLCSLNPGRAPVHGLRHADHHARATSTPTSFIRR